MLSIHKLAQFNGPLDNESILIPTSKPAIYGTAASEFEWRCHKCDTLLAASMSSRQLLDILIKCYSCGEIGALPRRSPGDPIARNSVVLNVGKYLLQNTIEATPVPIVGERALQAYELEVGRTDQDKIIPVSNSLMISEKNLLDLAQKAIELLGDEYEKLAASDCRGLLSPTPPPRRHRIVELIAHAQNLAEVYSNTGSGLAKPADAVLLTELMAIVGLFDRWKNHPAYAQLLATLKSDVDVPHTVMTLAVASYLADAGNGVGIVHEDGAGRIPDIQLLATLNTPAEVEIKAPTTLYGPFPRDPSGRAVEKKIKSLVKDAASAKRGQLDASGSGLLVICGFHFGPTLMSKLITAGRNVLNSQLGRKRHLAGLGFFDLTSIDVGSGTRPIILPVLNHQFVPHPSYSGPISLDSNPPRTFMSLDQLGSNAT